MEEDKDNEMEHVEREWRRIAAQAPPRQRNASSIDELEALRVHKDRVREFFAQLSAERRALVGDLIKEDKRKKCEARKSLVAAAAKKQATTQRIIVLKPRMYTRVSLGWKGDHNKDQHIFHHVIPFCSYTKRSGTQVEEDETMFGGINRCVFSNLFVDDEALRVDIPPEHASLMGHATPFQSALCAESYYMAAKCKHDCDAQFIMNELQKVSSWDVASFGHNRLELSWDQRERLVELGADPSDFMKVQGDDKECSGENSKWLRGRNGILSVREGWYDVRHHVFLYILRHKFGPGQKLCGTAVHQTVQALESLILEKEELPLIVEHRQKDGFWGDAPEEGSGFNVLGKTITQILLERTGKAEPVLMWKDDGAISQQRQQALATLMTPNNEIVDYQFYMP